MTDAPKPSATDAARQARLRDALRQNLKRRKSQSRGRAEQPRDLLAEAGISPDQTGKEPDDKV